MLRSLSFCLAAIPLATALAVAQDGAPPSDARDRVRGVRELARQGSVSIPQIAAYLDDVDLRVRVEAVKALVEIGGRATLDPLVKATSDPDAEVQIRAVDGLVNFYVPGYLKTGLSATLSRAGNVIRVKFPSENTQVVEPGIEVRPEVITAIGRLARGSSSFEVRANAARAVGILRGRAAVPDLIEAIRTKQDLVIYESLIALQKIGDPAAGPRIQFLVRDLDERIQSTAIETLGLLKTRDAIPAIRDVIGRSSSPKVKQAALSALAQMPDQASRSLFMLYLEDKDAALRTASLEGLARLENPADVPAFQKAFDGERRMEPRLAAAFGLVRAGKREMHEFSPLRYLVNTLNSKLHRQIAHAYLIELARDKAVRQSLYPVLSTGTRDEKSLLGMALAASGDAATLPFLQALARDPDLMVAQEGIKALRTLRSRLE